MLNTKDESRGQWFLFQAFNTDKNTANWFSNAEKAGYVVFKDAAIVTFYKHDLAKTPAKEISHQEDPDAILCGHVLAPLPRWTGTEPRVCTALIYNFRLL